MKNIWILILLTIVLTSCGTNTEEKQNTTSSQWKITTNTSQSSQSIQSQDATVIAVMKTSHWDITLELYGNKVPKTVTNFIVHAQNGYYDDVTFHRIINGFMIQGGDPLGTGHWGESIYGPKFDDEFDASLSNVAGTISMANSGPNTNGSQFFINQVDNVNLDFNKQPLASKHAVFGKVISWMDIVEKIALIPVDPTTWLQNEEVVIKNIELYTNTEWKLESYIIADTEKAKQDAIEKSNKLSEEKNNKSVENGDTVWVFYKLTDIDWNQLDGNFGSEQAFEFTVWMEWIISGFSNALKWMKTWETKTVTLSPDEWYGEYDENNTQAVPKELLTTFIEAGIELEAWNVLPTERWEFLIKDVNDTEVILDINHPLAWEELIFEIELKYFVN